MEDDEFVGGEVKPHASWKTVPDIFPGPGNAGPDKIFLLFPLPVKVTPGVSTRGDKEA